MKILVMGANGRLGKALVRRYSQQGLDVQAVGRAELDLEKPDRVADTLSRYDFEVLINAAGNTDVDQCELNPANARLINAASPAAAARHCAQRGARFVHVSTDYVFSGDQPPARRETDPTGPINHYGRSKLEGEQAVLAALPGALVTRVSWLFGIEKPSFPDWIIKQALAKEDVGAVDDKWSNPTFADDITEWLLALLQHQAGGVVHLCNQGGCSWLEYGQTTLDIAAGLGLPLKTRVVRGHTMQGFAPFKAARPPFTTMDTGLFTRLTGATPRPWQAALEDYVRRLYSPLS